MISQLTTKNLIVTLADENYLEQAKQLFSSVYWNAGWKGDYMLLAFQVPEEKLLWFRDKGILIYECKPLDDRPEAGLRNHPQTVLAKFYLFTEYFKQWKNIVFMDADIIVRASLDGLTAVRGFAAPNASGINLRNEFYPTDKALFRKLKQAYPLKGKAFNTGVLAFSTDIIDDQSFNCIMDLYREYGSLNVYGEEATLNLFFYKQWLMLSLIYNFYPEYMRLTYGIKSRNVRAVAVHFVSSANPWKEKSPFYAEWKNNYEKAELMDFSIKREAVKVWSEKETREYISHLKKRAVLYSYGRIFLLMDMNIGRVGLMIKKLYPGLYEKIRIKKNES